MIAPPPVEKHEKYIKMDIREFKNKQRRNISKPRDDDDQVSEITDYKMQPIWEQ